MKTEWWYESSLFDVDRMLVFARLTEEADGTARILTDAGESLVFPSKEAALLWLGDEEYYPFEHLLERAGEENLPLDPRIKPPMGQSDDELLPQMVVRLVETISPHPALPAPLVNVPTR
jgi:hypothetical protein